LENNSFVESKIVKGRIFMHSGYSNEPRYTHCKLNTNNIHGRMYDLWK